MTPGYFALTKDMADKDNKIKKLTDTLDKCYDFLKHNKLFETFMDLIKPKAKKRSSFHDRLGRKKEEVAKREAARVSVGKKRINDILI